MAHGNGNGNGNGNGRKALAVKTATLPEFGHGRPTDAWRTRMSLVLDRAKAAERIERIISEGGDSDALNATKLAAYYAHGMPVQQVEAKVAHIMIQVDV